MRAPRALSARYMGGTQKVSACPPCAATRSMWGVGGEVEGGAAVYTQLARPLGVGGGSPTGHSTQQPRRDNKREVEAGGIMRQGGGGGNENTGSI